MSYILEALKKAEQQRELGRVPGIASEHSAKSTRRRRWPWVLLLAVNAAVLAGVLWQARSTDAPLEAVRDVERPTPARPPVQTGAQQPSQPVVADVTVSDSPVRQQASRPAPEVVEPAMDAPPGAEDAADGMPVIEQPQVVPRPVAAPLLPVWPQIPGNIFEQLNGSLHLDVHVYSDQPQSRFVLINLRKYHEGDELKEGPVLEEITPEGVILLFRDQRFRVQRQ